MKEEQNKFKHGDKVTCKIHGEYIADAVITIGSEGTPHIAQNIMSGNNFRYGNPERFGYEYSWALNKDFTNYNVTDLKLKEEKTTPDYKVGTRIQNINSLSSNYNKFGHIIDVSEEEIKVMYDDSCKGYLYGNKLTHPQDFYRIIEPIIIPGGLMVDEAHAVGHFAWTDRGIVTLDSSAMGGWMMSTGTSASCPGELRTTGTFEAPVFTPPKKRVNFFID
jgi:hypothetical protein